MMILYQRQKKTGASWVDQGEPAPVPDNLLGWHDEALADVEAALPRAAASLGYAKTRFIPVEVSETPAAPPSQMIIKAEFLRLFTNAELVAIMRAAEANVDLAAYKYRLEQSQTVDLASSAVQAEMAHLEAGKLIGPGRAAQILAGTLPEATP